MIIDFHCHLDLYDNPIELAKQCNEKGVYVLSVTTTPKAWEITSSIGSKYKHIRTSLGLHPQVAHLRGRELGLFDSLVNNTRYIGEVGLDGSKDFKPYWKEQLSVFKHIIHSSHTAGNKILTLHSRSSASNVIQELKNKDLIPVLHWFSGDRFELKEALEIGAWFSINPMMLKSKKGLEIVSRIPKNRIITETDGPFGRINKTTLMPWDASKCHDSFANMWNCSINDVERQLRANFKTLLES